MRMRIYIYVYIHGGIDNTNISMDYYTVPSSLPRQRPANRLLQGMTRDHDSPRRCCFVAHSHLEIDQNHFLPSSSHNSYVPRGSLRHPGLEIPPQALCILLDPDSPEAWPPPYQNEGPQELPGICGAYIAHSTHCFGRFRELGCFRV